MSSTTRRRLLGAAGTAGAATLLPTNVQKALAAGGSATRPGRLSDIEHVVLLMQENRSFDHYFGTLSGVAGFDDPDAIKLSTGANGPYTMGYYTRQDIPFHYALADAFTICDHYHCSLFGPTWPNRMYWMTGTIDPAGTGGGPILDNSAPSGGYTWTTYAERLTAAGVS